MSTTDLPVEPARLLGQGFFWNDLKMGDRFRTFGRTITDADIVAFVGCTGMLEALFTDAVYREEHAAISGRVAPGALVYSIAEGLVLNASGNGTGLAFLNTEMNILLPTLANDTIHVEFEVTELRPAKSAGRGLVRTRNLVINQRGETVLEHNPLRLMAGKISAEGQS